MVAQAQASPREDATLSFKRFILLETSAFEQEPMADLFRVNLLGQMLDRYDELAAHGASGAACAQHVRREFADIADRMRSAGFEEIEFRKGRASSRWRLLTEHEAMEYLEESSAFQHRQSLSIAMFTSCAVPLFVACGFSEMLFGYTSDAASLFGLVGLAGTVGLGVYLLASSAKPKNEKKINSKKFSLTTRLQEKLEQMAVQIENKARRRKGKGIAMIVSSVAPLFLGAGLSEMWGSDFGTFIGLSGLLLMVAAGVYELVMGDGEKKAIRRLLKD